MQWSCGAFMCGHCKPHELPQHHSNLTACRACVQSHCSSLCNAAVAVSSIVVSADGTWCGCLVQVRDKQDSLRACMEDLANLTDHYNNVRAAKELAQKELAKIKRQVEEARHDWTRKIRERRAEVQGQSHIMFW